MLPTQKLLEPKRLAISLLATSIVMLVFISVAGMILLTGFVFLAAITLSINIEGDTVKFRVRRHPPWRLAVLALESLVVFGFAGFAFTRVPLGLVFYIGG